mmetsp:Transcript_46379/g.148985  ORF Transcript_46379/g.148985 Transcript_46379/m.148985 type:complete len:210 (-) Transcript_46379:153-782(-)
MARHGSEATAPETRCTSGVLLERLLPRLQWCLLRRHAAEAVAGAAKTQTSGVTAAAAGAADATVATEAAAAEVSGEALAAWARCAAPARKATASEACNASSEAISRTCSCHAAASASEAGSESAPDSAEPRRPEPSSNTSCMCGRTKRTASLEGVRSWLNTMVAMQRPCRCRTILLLLLPHPLLVLAKARDTGGPGNSAGRRKQIADDD